MLVQRLLLLLGLLIACKQVYAEDVKSKDLVKERITAKSILANARVVDENSKRHFKGTTLAYITPWNNGGYEAAKRHAAKFTYISPVWYRLERPKENEPLALVGKHDVDEKWMAEVRASASPAPLIVPRLYTEPSEKVTDVEWMVLVSDILQECAAHKFDGIVLDIGFAAVRAFQENRLGFLKHIAAQLHEKGLRFILSIPPYASMFSSANFQTLVDDVDAFSLMSYDFRTAQADAQGGPVSPHWWALQSVLALLPPELRSSPVRAKLLLGANMYGYEYSTSVTPRALTGDDYLRLLERNKATVRFDWDVDAHEHKLTYRNSDGQLSVAYYPTLLSLSDRIDLAESLGVGLSFWEIGQSLPYFFDLL